MPTGDRNIANEPTDEALDHVGLADVFTFPTLGRRTSPTPDVRLRDVVGEVLRDQRHEQERTLADVAAAAAVSLAYLSEVERGRKEISSDLLDAVTGALDITLIDVLERSVERLRTRMEGGSGFELRAA